MRRGTQKEAWKGHDLLLSCITTREWLLAFLLMTTVVKACIMTSCCDKRQCIADSVSVGWFIHLFMLLIHFLSVFIGCSLKMAFWQKSSSTLGDTYWFIQRWSIIHFLLLNINKNNKKETRKHVYLKEDKISNNNSIGKLRSSFCQQCAWSMLFWKVPGWLINKMKQTIVLIDPM